MLFSNVFSRQSVLRRLQSDDDKQNGSPLNKTFDAARPVDTHYRTASTYAVRMYAVRYYSPRPLARPWASYPTAWSLLFWGCQCLRRHRRPDALTALLKALVLLD